MKSWLKFNINWKINNPKAAHNGSNIEQKKNQEESILYDQTIWYSLSTKQVENLRIQMI